MATLIQSMQNILSQKDPLLPNETRRVILKEFLQAYTLDFLYNHPVYRKLNYSVVSLIFLDGRPLPTKRKRD